MMSKNDAFIYEISFFGSFTLPLRICCSTMHGILLLCLGWFPEAIFRSPRHASETCFVRALVLHLLIHFDLIVVMWLVKVCCLCTVSKSTLLNFLVPLLFCHSCSTRFANTHHNFAISIPWYCKEVYANSLFYGILYLQIYNLNHFKGNVNRHLTPLRTALTFHLLVFLSFCNSMPSSDWLLALCGIKTIKKIFASIVTFFWAICSIVK